MKVAINRCFGGFSLSAKAAKRLMQMQGKEVYFFKWEITPDEYTPITEEEANKSHFVSIFTIPNPNEVLGKTVQGIGMTMEERQADNDKHKLYSVETRPENRHDPLLIQVIEDLGEDANGPCARIKIVEIPDNTDYAIEEYDGMESIHEKHRSWS